MAITPEKKTPTVRRRTATKIVLKDYVRFQLGEGIEKKQDDFAAEVAAAAGVKKDEPVA